MFLAEVAVYVAVGAAGWRVHAVVGLAGIVLMAVWWGLFHSPKAKWPARGTTRTLGVTAWFGIGVLALGWLVIGS